MPKLNIPTPNTTAGGQNYTFSSKFHVTVSVTIEKVWWWRSGATPFPNEIRIRNINGSVTVLQMGPAALTWVAVSDGWYTADVAANGLTPPVLAADTSYAVSFYGENAGFTQAYNTGSIVPDSPYVWDGASYSSGNTPYGTTGVPNSEKYGIDIESAAAAGGGGDTMAAGLAPWFNADGTNLHQGALPWLTWVIAQNVSNAQTALSTAVANVASSLVNVSNMVTAIRAGSITSFAEAYLAQVALMNTALFGTSTPPAGGVQQLIEEGNASALDATNQTLRPSAFEASTSIVDGYALLNAEGDYYTIDIDTYPPEQPHLALGAGWLPKLGWYSLRYRSSYYAERRFCDWESGVIFSGQERADGCLVHLRRGVEGTVTAYRYT